MKMWKRTGVALIAAVLFAAPMAEGAIQANQGSIVAKSEDGVTQADQGSEAKRLAEAEAQLMAQTLIDGYGASGVQYAIRSKGEIVLSGGIGVDAAGNKTPIGNNVMFAIGSVSKMYVTAATMMLADAGKVDIDSPLTNYIPDFTMADERYKQITPRMLMNHSAGFYGSHYRNSMLFADNDTENHDLLLQNLRSERLKSEPGEYSVYANDGFQLLEILVERVSGMSYTQFLAQSISAPLGLTSTKTPLDTFDRSQIYSVHVPGIDGALPVENANVLGTGGIYSTAEELTLFSEVLTGKQPDLLSEAAALAMQQPEYRNGVWVDGSSNVYGYGLGWDSVDLAPFDDYGIQAVTKGGNTILYHAAYIVLPEQEVSIAFLTAGGPSTFNTAAASNILLAYLKGSGEIKDIRPDKTFEAPVKKEMPDHFKAYSGLYRKVGSTLSLTVKDGEINLPAMKGGLIPEQTYVYIGDQVFMGEDGRTAISFDEQSNGKTYVRVQSVLEFPGFGQSALDHYELQKLDANTPDDSITQVWKKRDGKTYYAVNEKINSLFYFSPQVLSKMIQLDEGSGYANGTIIMENNKAMNIAEIPVMNGRDAFDLIFYKENGIEYLQSGGWTFISETAIMPIYNGSASTVTIPASGHARWFQIGEGAGGRSMTVEMPESSGFVVYDANGIPIQHSVASGSSSVILPAGGLIVFGGEAGDIFKIALKRK
ncbi:serine hydrolase [Paenibacillus oryzae]|uniref:Serine hydrolase n=1 Tax=Paenibacillus oryzae TaxID=1844972 RepID=A0A1A5YPS5_9BACL|nr:serine hydrolase domain-containing protein [Paenibacillus oryzae]OBR67604.1 serine hydrolase [Paenibacillus oryzae]